MSDLVKEISAAREPGDSRDLLHSLRELRLDRDVTERPQEKKAVRPRIGQIASFALGSLFSLVLVLAFTRSPNKEVDPPTPVTSATASKTAVANSNAEGSLVASGFVVARRQATVASQVTGQIVSLEFEEGQKVEKGEILARIDPKLAEAEVASTRANLANSVSQVSALQAELRQADLSYSRNRELDARGFVTKSALDESRSQLRAYGAKVAASQAQVRSVQASLAGALATLDRYTIRAPFAGVIVNKNAQLGETISPLSAGGGFTRTGICTLIDMQSLEVEADIGEAMISSVTVGEPVDIRLSSNSSKAYRGRVLQKIPSASRDRETVRIRVAFDRVDDGILPEMAAKVTFH